MPRRLSVSAAFIVSALALGACAKDASQSVAAAAPTIVTVHAKDFAFALPDTISAGVVTFKLVNDGPGLHHMQIVRLDSAKTVDDLVAAMKKPGPPPAWASFVSGPNAATPGRESNETLDIGAGSYALLCLVDLPGGVPHFTKGMAKLLVVKPAAAGAVAAAMPAADIKITLSDYSFQFSTPITAGSHTFEVTTMPGQPHEVEIVKLVAGKKPEDVFAWMPTMQGPPPMEYAIGGVAATSTGVVTRFTADFAPGDYMIACFLPDPKDGKMHAMHGMVQTFRVN